MEVELQEVPNATPSPLNSSAISSMIPLNQEPNSPIPQPVIYDSIQDLISSKTRRNQTVLCVFTVVACTIFLIFIFCLILGCIIGVILFFAYSNSRRLALQSTLKTLGDAGNTNLDRTVFTAIHELQGINSMIAVYGTSTIDDTSIVYCPNCTLGAPTVTPEQFYNFIQKANTRVDKFLLRYCPIVYEQDREAYIETVRRFIPNYTIWGGSRNNTLSGRGVYNPVLYLYPDTNNNTVAGVDNMFSTIARNIIVQANSTGQLYGTPRIRLVQETLYFYGFTIITPVMRDSIIIGTVNGVFNVSKLTEDTFFQLLDSHVDVVIVDDTGDVPIEQQFLHSTIPSDFNLPLPTILQRYNNQILQYNTTIQVTNRRWRLYYFPRDAFVNPSNFVDHILSLLLSMGISLFIATVLSFIFCIVIYSFVLTCIIKERTQLLFKMLPKSIVTRISNGETVIADQLSNVTVLFADLVGFTHLSSQLPVTTLVALLNQLFCNLDEELLRYKNIEKIKTIGDCYMACSGLQIIKNLNAHSNHQQQQSKESVKESAVQMGYFALQMLQIMKSTINVKYGLELRIGISHGECIAGVLGKQRPAYDVWGETVNMASRMESLGVPHRIQVSQPFKQLVEDEFEFEARGLIQVKGKGMMETFFLLGPKANTSTTQEVVAQQPQVEMAPQAEIAPQTSTQE